MPQAFQEALFPETCDFDIENAAFTFCLQLIEHHKLDHLYRQAFDPELSLLKSIVDNRDGLISTKLKVPQAIGKKQLLRVLGGSKAPETSDEEAKTVWKTLTRLSRFLRWVAMSAMPREFEELQKERDRWAEASVMAYWWQSAETHCGEAWDDFICQYACPHITIAFDGKRLSTSRAEQLGPYPFTDFCEASQQHIRGVPPSFDVKIRIKRHLSLVQLVEEFAESSPSASKPANVQDCTSGSVNWKDCCIWVAAAHISKKYPEVEAAMVEWKNSCPNAVMASYREVFLALGIQATPCLDIDFVEGRGSWFLHLNGVKGPHCIAVEAFQGRVTVFCAGSEVSIPLGDWQQMLSTCTEHNVIMGFHLHTEPLSVTPPHLDLLFDIRAGADQEEADVILEDDAEEPEGEEEDTSIVYVGNTLLNLLDTESTSEHPGDDDEASCEEEEVPKVRCFFCAERAFQSIGRRNKHLSLYHTPKQQFVASGTKQMKMICAMFDEDVLNHEPLQPTYLQRSARLLRESIIPRLSEKVNEIDRHIRLVFDRTGPRYVHLLALGDSEKCRRVGYTFYTHAFAECVRSELMICKAKVKMLMGRMLKHAKDANNPLVSLYPLHVKSWWPIVEDIFMSQAAQILLSDINAKLRARHEMRSISVDATLRCCFSLLDQKAHVHSQRRLLTVRGLTGCVLLMEPLDSDRAPDIARTFTKEWSQEVRNAVEFASSDNASGLLFSELKRTFPSLRILNLDPVHLAISYEYATWRKKTAGSWAVRRIMAKFDRADFTADENAWGAPHGGGECTAATNEEVAFRKLIQNSKMLLRDANDLLQNIDYEKPWYYRIDFVKAMAAVARVHRDEMDRVAPGPNRPVRELLFSACEPKRCEWYFNNIRTRRLLGPGVISLLASGTASNESLHAEINNWFRQTQHIHEPVLQIKLRVLLMAKQMPHLSALCDHTLRQLPAAIVSARVTSQPLMTEQQWQDWCEELGIDFIQKADVPLSKARNASCGLYKRPARPSDRTRPKRKRTPFTLDRRGTLRTGGVNRHIRKRPAGAATLVKKRPAGFA